LFFPAYRQEGLERRNAMKKWKYRVFWQVVTKDIEYQEKLDKYGAEGWEIIKNSILPSHTFPNDGNSYFYVLFKREIPEPETPPHPTDGVKIVESPVRTFGEEEHHICYICYQNIFGGEKAWSDHFLQEHPNSELPKFLWPKKSDGDSKPPNLDLSYDGPSTPDDSLSDAWDDENEDEDKGDKPSNPQIDQTAEIHEDRRKFADFHGPNP